MTREKSLITRIADTIGEARGKAEEIGVSLTRKMEAAARGANREVKKAGTLVERTTQTATTRVRRNVKAAASSVKKVAGDVERAMTPRKAAPKRRRGSATTRAGQRSASAKATPATVAVRVKSAARKAGAAVTKAVRAARGKPARKTRRASRTKRT